ETRQQHTQKACLMTSHKPGLFVFTTTAPTNSSTLSLHDALPICFYGGAERHQLQMVQAIQIGRNGRQVQMRVHRGIAVPRKMLRSEEHTSELQSLRHLVCRLLLEKKKIEDTDFPDSSARSKIASR